MNRHSMQAFAATFVAATSLVLASCTANQARVGTTPPSSVKVTGPAPSSPSPSSPAIEEAVAFLRKGDVWLQGADGAHAHRVGLKGVTAFSWVRSTELDVVVGSDPSKHFLVDLAGHRTRLPFPSGGSWARDGARYVVPVGQKIVVFERDGKQVASLDAGPGIDHCANPPRGHQRLRFGTPVLAPDGQRVLVAGGCFLESGAYNQPARIYSVSLDGKLNRPLGKLATNLRELSAPLPSPDERSIAQSDSGGSSICPSRRNLTVADARGGGVRQLAPAAQASLDPQLDYVGGLTGYDWSPASDRLVAGFQIDSCDLRSGKFEPVLNGLYVLSPVGNPERRLTKAAASDPAWSPSGRFIAWVKGAVFGGLATFTLNVMDLSTSDSIEIGDGSQPAWQPKT